MQKTRRGNADSLFSCSCSGIGRISESFLHIAEIRDILLFRIEHAGRRTRSAGENQKHALPRGIILENSFSGQQKLRKWIVQLLKLLLACALIYWVVCDINFADLRQFATGRIVLFTVLGALAIGIQLVLCAVRWQILLRIQHIPIPFRRALSLSMQGTFFSLCMPGGAVGGDVVKAAFLIRETHRGQKLSGVTSIFIDRVIGMLALFLLVAAAVTFALPTVLAFDAAVKYPVLFLYVLCIAGLCAGIALFFQDVIFRIPLARRCLEFADPLMKGRLKSVLDSVEAYRRDPVRLLAAFLLSILVMHPLLVAGLILIVIGITGEVAYTAGAAFASLLGSTAAAIPVTPGGLGTRDKITQLVLESMGVGQNAAGFAPLFYTVALLAVSLTGVFFFLSDSWLRKMEKIQKDVNMGESG